MKKIVIAGINGFMGKYLSRYFLSKGWQVVGLVRKKSEVENGVTTHIWDGKNLDNTWAQALENADLLVNLAGRTVNCRYNDKNKQQIIDSRVQSTSVLGAAVGSCSQPPKLWINASTATIYRDSYDTPQTESDGEIGTGFSVEVAKAWEKAFHDAEVDPKVRKIALRTSLVMAEEPGTVLEVLTGLAKKYLGGKMGSGKQMVSWIEINDACRAIEWMYENQHAEGAYNLASPTPLTNAEMMKLIRKRAGRSFGLPAAKWMLEIGAFFLRTETELILKSRYVHPKRLLDEGFVFKYENFEELV